MGVAPVKIKFIVILVTKKVNKQLLRKIRNFTISRDHSNK